MHVDAKVTRDGWVGSFAALVTTSLTKYLPLTPGQRPFLPNMSPGQWIDHVECKRYDDISVVQDIEGEIRWMADS